MNFTVTRFFQADSVTPDPVAHISSESGDECQEPSSLEGADMILEGEPGQSREGLGGTQEYQASPPNASATQECKARRPARGSEPFEKWERDEMEKLLGELCGHLGAHWFWLFCSIEF